MFIDCVDVSLMNKPGDLQGAKVNLLCINKLVGSICSFYELKMEVGKSENYPVTQTLPTNKPHAHIRAILEISFVFFRLMRCGCQDYNRLREPVTLRAIGDVAATAN